MPTNSVLETKTTLNGQGYKHGLNAQILTVNNKTGKMDIAGGLEKNDLGALTTDQQNKLNEYKIRTRFANEKYLRSHPEIGCLLSSFLSDVLNERPENIRAFAAAHFTNPELPLKIKALTQNKLSKIKSSQ